MYLFADLLQDISASVAKIFMSCELVVKVLNMFENFMQIFAQNISQDCRATVVRQSYDIRASVANCRRKILAI